MFVRFLIELLVLQYFNFISADEFLHCDEFSKGASFDPTEVVDSDWRVFYYWDKYGELLPIKFALPAQQDIYLYKKAINVSGLADIFDFSKAKLIMFPTPTASIMFFEKDKPTAYQAILLRKITTWNPNPIDFTEVRIKNVGRYIGIMICNENAVYAMAREKEMPANEDLEKAAATVFKGIEGLEGRSYLYRPPKDL